MAYLQDTISTLSRFWSVEGCLVLPPFELGVPAGSMHPDAFFRLLAPEPWRAAFLQPVRRPLDGRYGHHPFRLSRHLQYQVVLKGPPPDVKALYLRSLETLGCELGDHDLRFADWTWDSRALGGWGVGWQVQIDGLGVTRISFMQQVAGRELDPLGVEISYGVERLVMALARVRNAFHLRWNANGPDYARLRQRDEEELTRYAAEVADPDHLHRCLEEFLDEAGRALEAGLPRPTYELAIKSLQRIDLLEARGELSSRRRDEWLDRVRALVVAAAGRYLEDRGTPTPADGDGRGRPPLSQGGIEGGSKVSE